MVDLRINETPQTGAVRKPHVPFSRLVGTVSNSADAVRLETAPTGGGESVCFFRIHYSSPVGGISESRYIAQTGRKPCLQKCRDMNLDLRVFGWEEWVGQVEDPDLIGDTRPTNYRSEEIESISVPTFL